MKAKTNGKAVRGNGSPGKPGRAGKRAGAPGDSAGGSGRGKAARAPGATKAQPARVAGLAKAGPKPGKRQQGGAAADGQPDGRRDAGKAPGGRGKGKRAQADQGGAQGAVKRTGRPTVFTKERWAHILERQARGVFLERICREAREGNEAEGIEPDPSFPQAQTVREWILEDHDLFTDLARAREMGIEALIERSLDVADDGSNDYMLTKQGLALDREHVQRSKLRIDTVFRMAEVLAPRRFGRRLELSGDPDRPVSGKSLAAIPESELVAQYEAMLKRRTTK